MSRAPYRPLRVMIVEDNPADVRLTIEAFKDGQVAAETTTASDGVQAMSMLLGEAPYADVARPDVVLLDLNLPRKSGRELLMDMKANERLRDIPVLVMTASRHDRDYLRSLDVNPDGFLSKPLDADEFLEFMRARGN